METYKDYLPKYIQIKELIKTRIKNGFYKHGQKLKPRTALAREFNTTLATCSKAVDELLDEKELETQIGVGTFIAGKNIEKKLQIYGTVRTLNNPFYGKFADSLNRTLMEKNFLPPKIISTQYDPAKEAETVKALLAENNSIIVMCGFLSDETRQLILKHPERFYIFGHAPELKGKANQIVSDTEQGAFISVRHLIEMGHRDIAIITGLLNDFKVKAYKQALKETGLKYDESYIVGIDNSDKMPAEKLSVEINLALDKFLKCRRVPTAVFCTSDFFAMNFISACQMRELKIPYDFSVCGYDGAFEGHTGACQITTAVQPLDGLFNGILKHLGLEKQGSFLHLKLSPVLRLGNTVKNMNKG